MAKADVLDRVAADLDRGLTQPAIARLNSLVKRYPADLDLRRRLAAVYRMIGNRIEAGRWSYLHPDADPDETHAFERAFPTPDLRLRALRWRDQANAAATAYARRRLEDLTAAATAARRPATSAARMAVAGYAMRRASPQGAAGIPRDLVLGLAGAPRLLVLSLVMVASTLAVIFAAVGAVTIAQWVI